MEQSPSSDPLLSCLRCATDNILARLPEHSHDQRMRRRRMVVEMLDPQPDVARDLLNRQQDRRLEFGYRPRGLYRTQNAVSPVRASQLPLAPASLIAEQVKHLVHFV